MAATQYVPTSILSGQGCQWKRKFIKKILVVRRNGDEKHSTQAFSYPCEVAMNYAVWSLFMHQMGLSRSCNEHLLCDAFCWCFAIKNWILPLVLSFSMFSSCTVHVSSELSRCGGTLTTFCSPLARYFTRDKVTQNNVGSMCWGYCIVAFSYFSAILISQQ